MKHESLGNFTSSNVDGAVYDHEKKTLAVTYKGGALYHYPKVEPATWEGLKKASSKGSFIAGSIIPTHKGARQK